MWCRLRPFKFLRIWDSHEELISLVQLIWNSNIGGCAMFRISRKLKLLKRALKSWNQEVFGRVNVELKKLEDRIFELEVCLARNVLPQTELELLTCKQEHIQWVHQEEILAYQKSRVKWLAEGDSNKKKFHVSLRVKRKSKIIKRMQLDNGEMLDSSDAVHEGAVSFFQQLLSMMPIERDLGEMKLIQPVVSMEENEALCAAPSMEEIKQSLWSIPADNSPGPNGFSASFFMLA
ncbi:hypothetical protein I3842_13G108400 [Carya illinoinensis]|uniref:RNA-directed DNA polymerase (Reverse transcriptase) n=1 Tax=Carya illinoinensis TaxID=32201 RepID=A0A922AJK2_CARIL|nr:hypothetical protein I3842_13G108400 [Carya illinoinensis]